MKTSGFFVLIQSAPISPHQPSRPHYFSNHHHVVPTSHTPLSIEIFRPPPSTTRVKRSRPQFYRLLTYIINNTFYPCTQSINIQRNTLFQTIIIKSITMKRLHLIIQKHSHVNIHFIRSTPWNSSIPLHVRLLSSSTFTMEPPDKFTITIYIIIKDRTPRGRTQKV